MKSNCVHDPRRLPSRRAFSERRTEIRRPACAPQILANLIVTCEPRTPRGFAATKRSLAFFRSLDWRRQLNDAISIDLRFPCMSAPLEREHADFLEPNATFRLLQHYERHTGTNPLGCYESSCARRFASLRLLLSRLGDGAFAPKTSAMSYSAEPRSTFVPPFPKKRPSPVSGRSESRTDRRNSSEGEIRPVSWVAEKTRLAGRLAHFGYRRPLARAASLLDASPSPSCRQERERCKLELASSLVS